VFDSEAAAFAEIKKFLSFMPENIWQRPVQQASEDKPERREEALLNIVPKDARKPFDMRKVIKLIMDIDSWLEIAPLYGRGQIIGLARLNGSVVGVIANDCKHYAGAMTAQGSQKAKRMMELCDTFHIPIVNFMDEPGFMIGPESEASAAIKYGKMCCRCNPKRFVDCHGCPGNR
jgi:acetyl-CoA carboxylase carboxyltransferase component